MSITEAIRQADAWVQMIGLNKGEYQVNHWSIEHRAWWAGSITNRPSALRTRFENRIALALELLGYSNVDACTSAYGYSNNLYPYDWRQCVRDEIRAARLAEVICPQRTRT